MTRSPLTIVQELLLDEAPDYSSGRIELEQARRPLTGLDAACGAAAHRLAVVLEGLAVDHAGIADVAVLIRQVIRAHGRRLWVGEGLWTLLAGQASAFGLRATMTGEHGRVELTADSWEPEWLPGAREIDRLAPRRGDSTATGDGLLHAMTGYPGYQSPAQKAAVAACLFAPPGSTTLVTLPTGAGKSICALLPAWCDAQGGRAKGGTTLVVVPTVSLALDQEARAGRLFAAARDATYTPASWTGTTSANEKATIRQGLRDGTLPLLYLAPEALLHADLAAICLDSARAGTLRRLVIDEAHLVETWGAGFRTEFQYLAAYRRQLLAASGGELRTLLLSATVSPRCDALLERLFGGDSFQSIRANQLRPEPSYWFGHTTGQGKRRERIIAALTHLPRPAIVYVTKPDDAEDWAGRLRQEGYRRVATFTGQTEGDDRQRLLQGWQDNAYDIMVATSAFGLGVDKGDVRTIVHACLPGDIDRFYQEVGRGGRDGLSAISLICPTYDDAKLAYGMITKARITPERAYDRWEGMRAAARVLPGGGDTLLVDTNSLPEDEPDMRRSERNREWNEHTLLLMQRAGLLDIVDNRERIDEVLGEAADSPPPLDRMRIRVLDAERLGDPGECVATIDRTRQIEQRELRQAVGRMEQLVARFSSGADSCLAYDFRAEYPGAALACGGCPACRSAGRSAYAQPMALELDLAVSPAKREYLDGELSQYLGCGGTLNAVWGGGRELAALADLRELLVDLVGAGCQQLVLPGELLDDPTWTRELVAALARHATIPHVIWSADWVVARADMHLFALPTVVLYPATDGVADAVHQSLGRRWSQMGGSSPRINIVHQDLYLASESGRFIDRVDGLTDDLARLRGRLRSIQEFAFF